MRIQPTIVSDASGYFGILFPEDAPGFTKREFGSIPPVLSEDALLEDLDPELEDALERLIVDPQDLKWLEEEIQATILILKYGYVSQIYPGVSAEEEALSHRSPRVQYLWTRLNWSEIISLNYESLGEERVRGAQKFYADIGQAPPTEALYHTPFVRWSYMSVDCDGYAGAGWCVRARFRKT